MTPSGATLPRYGAVGSWLQRWFGTRVQSVPSNPSAGATTGVLIKSSPNRLGFTVINLSANTVYVAPAEAGAVSSTNGVQLQPNGGSLSVQVQNDGDLSEHQWNMIAPAGASQLFLNELTAY